MIALEESPYYEVRWEPIEGAAAIAPGATMSGFTIVMRHSTPQLTSGQ